MTENKMPPAIDDVNLLAEAEALDYAWHRRVFRLGIVTAVAIGPNAEIEVRIDGQTTSIQVPKNQDVTFSVNDRCQLIDTNGKGGYVALLRWLV